MRRIVASIALLLASLTPVLAQGFIPASAPPYVLADSYGRWVLQGQAANTYTFQVSGFSPCQITQLNYSDSSTFYAFNDFVALAPVFIQDNNQANSEVVTPGSYLTPTSTSCGPALAPARSHTTFSEQSGTGGLQEAINVHGASSFTVPIVLSAQWYKLLSGIAGNNATLASTTTPADVLTNATCNSHTQVVDITTRTMFNCNASGKLIVANVSNQATVAAGAGAGTSPTIALLTASSTGTGTITLTTGTTPTASAAVFTVTMSTPNVGGFAYAPVCTVTSVGTRAYTSGVVTTTAGSGGTAATLVLTASSTALTASVSGYKFSYSCH